MNTDPIADLLTRIRNAYNARKDSLTVPHSKTKMAILSVLKSYRFVTDYSEAKTEKESHKTIEITLNPEKRDLTINRKSKPGQRIYVKSENIKKVHGGLGVAIISTPKGIISSYDAKKMNVGGEVICEVY